MKNLNLLSNLKHDLPASVVVFFVALPLCLGIALASGAPLFSGLIAGIIGGIVVGSLSGSQVGVSGPAAGLAAIVLTAIGDLGGFQNFLFNKNKSFEILNEQSNSIYNIQREQLELDNLNLLYVALTRPIEQLYIISEKKTTAKKETPKKVEKEKVQVKEVIKETVQKTSENIEEVKEIKKTIPTEQSTQKTIEPIPKIDYQENMLIDKYASKLREEINKNKTYPTISKKLHEQGNVIISFRVLKSGKFINIRLISSSNKERLDKAALNALYDTKEFEVFDKAINKEFLDFNLPLEFKLN